MSDITTVNDQILERWFYALNDMLAHGMLEAREALDVVITEMKRREMKF